MNPAKRGFSFFLSAVLLSLSLLLGSCAQKAKTIQVGAAQFEAESLAAIDKIDELRRQEIEAAPQSPEKASEFFIAAVKSSQKPFTRQTLRIILNPFQRTVPRSEAQWGAFLQKMRAQYTTFAATFSSLDRGGLFAGSAVEQTIPILDKLIAQMAAFADSLIKHPPEFLAERAAIAAELEIIRETKPFTEVTDVRLLDAERRLRALASAEEQMARDTIEQALKAATLGTELRKLLLDFNNLNVNDIAEGLAKAFKLVSGIPGLDLAGLESSTNQLVAQIKADASLQTFFNTALGEISRARDVRS